MAQFMRGMKNLNFKNQSGMSTWLIIGIVAIVVLGAISLFGGDEDESLQEQLGDISPEELQKYQEQVIGKPEAQEVINYSGKVVAGGNSKILEFSRPDYDAANAAGKLIMLYFTNATCGNSCATGIAEMKKAFSQINRVDVVGFVADLSNPVSKEVGIFSTDGKVLIRSGQVVIKSPFSWNAQEILANVDAFTYSPEDF